MEKSKLIQLLATFSVTELREFKDFIASPFYNKNEELIPFYAYLRKYAPTFPLKKINKIQVYKQVFKGKPYNEKHIHYLMSFLLKLAEHYISVNEFHKQGSLKEHYTLSSFINRGLEKHYHFAANAANKKLQQSTYRNTDYYFQKYLLAEASNRFFSNQKIRKFDPSLQDASDNFDIYYLCNKLRYTCEMLNRKIWISADYELKLLEEIQSFLEKNPPHDVPPVEIYFQILSLQVNEDVSHFEQLKVLIQKYKTQFPKNELWEIYVYAINYSIRMLNQGHQEFLEELFNLYLDGIESELLFEGDYLSPWAYKNTIKLGLRLERFDWVESFIHEYNPRLSDDFQQNAFHFNMADLFYYKKDYDQAHFHLNQVEFTDIYISLESKKMMVKIFFESNEEEALLSSIIAFKAYIKRNKLIPSDLKVSYQNFLTIINLMSKKELKYQAKIQSHFEEMNQLIDRNWLKRQFERSTFI